MKQVQVAIGERWKMRIKRGSTALVLIQLSVLSAVIGVLSPIASAASNDTNIITSQLDSADNLEPEFVPGEVLVRFRRSISLRLTGDTMTTGVASVDKLNKRFEVKEIKRLFSDVYKLKLPKDADVLSIARKYEEDPSVEYAEPNPIGHYFAVPNDAGYKQQWAHTKIQSEYAWNRTTGDPNVVIAIVDSGVQYYHPDLAANIWNNTDETPSNGIDDDHNGYIDDIRGWDFAYNNNDPRDSYGHGTHVAGIAAAVTNNSIGVAGVSWHSAIMVLKNGPPLTVESCASAIMYAVDNGADIISMSWGFRSRSETLHNTLKYAFDRGLLLVAAAGNEHWDIRIYPAAYEEVIAVTATDQSDNPWVGTIGGGGSNYGAWVEIAAPGKDLYSTYISPQYVNESGTSGAAPQVAGLAALVWSRFPNMTRDQVREQLRRTAVDCGTPGFDNSYGYGRINASGAVNQDIPDHDLLVWSWKLPFASEPDDEVIVNTTVLNFGNSTESNVYVRLLVNGTQVDSENITILDSGNSAIVSCLWTPTVRGKYNVTTCVEPKENEAILENNVRSANAWVKSGRVTKVPQEFATIKEAVEATNPRMYCGDATIQVASNKTYYEHDLLIQNSLTSLTLVGENRSTTIIDSQGQGDASIIVNSANVAITGFTIQDSTGIRLFYSDKSSITFNTINGSGSSSGIYIESDIYKSTVNNCTVLNSIKGIELSGSGGHIIGNNTILYSSSDGIHLHSHYDSYAYFPSGGHIISSNRILHSGDYGIHLHESDNNTISGNLISNSQYGLEIFCSNVNSVNYNTISDCSLYGIEIFSVGIPRGGPNPSENNFISANTLEFNQHGIYLSSNLWGRTQDNIISDNTVSNNYYGVYSDVYTDPNIIYHNNIINNTVQATDLGGNDWDDGYPSGGNYWSDSNGTDLYSGPNQNQTGSDGIRDTPYVINTYDKDNYPLTHPWRSIRNVDTGLMYLTIQKAIDAPETLNGHTIEVKADKYCEYVVVNKSLTLIGEDPSTTIIDGSGSGHVVTIQASNVSLSQFTIQNGLYGVTLDGVTLGIVQNTAICSNIILSNTYFGVSMIYTSHCLVKDNTISTEGFGLRGVSVYGVYNSISGNIIHNYDFGVEISDYENNLVSGNVISNSEKGIYLISTDRNTIYHNSFINNIVQAYVNPLYPSVDNTWDDGYPSGGNYWSDFETRYPDAKDDYSGPYQNQFGSDGIWDRSYNIDGSNIDRYPLVDPWPAHNVAVIDVVATPTEVLQGDSVSVIVTVMNQGDFTETFNVTAYYDNNVICTQVVSDLDSRESRILIFPWNTDGTTPRSYAVRAFASVVPNEANTDDNTKIDGTVTIKAWNLLDEPWNQLTAWTTEGKGVSTIATLDEKNCLYNKPNKGTYITRKKDIGTLPETGYTAETSLYVNSWGTGDTNSFVTFKFYDGMHLVTIEIHSNCVVGLQSQFSLITQIQRWYKWRFVVDSDADTVHVYRDGQYVGTLTGLKDLTANDGLIHCALTENPTGRSGCESYTDYMKIATGLYTPT